MAFETFVQKKLNNPGDFSRSALSGHKETCKEMRERELLT